MISFSERGLERTNRTDACILCSELSCISYTIMDLETLLWSENLYASTVWRDAKQTNANLVRPDFVFS